MNEKKIKRRDFLQYTAAIPAGAGMLGAKPVFGAAPDGERDTYGGWTGKKFEPTGFFRVEKDDTGFLIINASVVLHLNETAVEIGKAILEGLDKKRSNSGWMTCVPSFLYRLEILTIIKQANLFA